MNTKEQLSILRQAWVNCSQKLQSDDLPDHEYNMVSWEACDLLRLINILIRHDEMGYADSESFYFLLEETPFASVHEQAPVLRRFFKPSMVK